MERPEEVAGRTGFGSQAHAERWKQLSLRQQGADIDSIVVGILLKPGLHLSDSLPSAYIGL